MPKRDGMNVGLIPSELLYSGHDSETVLYARLQSLNKHNDIERDGFAVFTIGPKEWAKLMPITKRSVQTMKRWLTTLERAGWARIERLNKDTHRVTIYGYDPVKKGHRYGPTKKTQSQSNTTQ